MRMDSPPPGKAERLDSVDCLRGLVIVLMALDHTKGFFFGGFSFGAENPAFASPWLFFTRWVTHFCAPTFVLLAGLGAFLSRSRGMTRPRLAAFLLSRGLWLVVLELTVVHFGWSWEWNFRQGMWQVIWAVGWSMVGLSFLVWLPAWVVGLLGGLILGGHNVVDGVGGVKVVAEYPWLACMLGERGWLWDVLHTTRPFSPAKGYLYYNLYPVLPWFGVLCAGYGLGPVMALATPRRRKVLLALGAAAVVGFVALRYCNTYGDPSRWRVIPGGEQPVNGVRTTMSFLACTKYPPSLLFVLMTLGPALLMLVLLEWRLPYVKRFFLTYGRVPLFFYVVHLPVLNGMARLVGWLISSGYESFAFIPLKRGYELPGVYLIWVAVVLVLYFPCLGYGWLKKRYGGVFKYL